MARAPDERVMKAYELYKTGMKLVDIAGELNVPDGTVRRWKSTFAWETVRSKKNANVRKKRAGAPRKNKNAVGHGAPLENKNAETHGLFTKWLPEETQKIMGELTSISPLDLLWNNIILQIAAIIRAQNIMHVTDKDEIIKEIIKHKASETERENEDSNSKSTKEETEYAFQFAWDRQATFMNAQSRAYTTLNSMLKQYDEMLHKNWDLATEEQKARIAMLNKQAEAKEEKDNEVTVVMSKELEGWAE
ncbi:MAG TPA: phage terminase small subunit [Anaerovoracaceae bacterium]|nr:phage terminase small subunit [Anaerovoracaceae bacterium]